MAQSPSSPPGIFGEDVFEPLEGTDVPLRPGLLGDPQGLGRLGAVELLEVPQGQHLAVDRVEAVERLLDPEQPLGPVRRLRGRGEPAQQHRGQRGRAGLGQRLAVERRPPGRRRASWCPGGGGGASSAARRRSAAARGTAAASGSRRYSVQARRRVQEGVLEHVGRRRAGPGRGDRGAGRPSAVAGRGNARTGPRAQGDPRP